MYHHYSSFYGSFIVDTQFSTRLILCTTVMCLCLFISPPNAAVSVPTITEALVIIQREKETVREQPEQCNSQVQQKKTWWQKIILISGCKTDLNELQKGGCTLGWFYLWETKQWHWDELHLDLGLIKAYTFVLSFLAGGGKQWVGVRVFGAKGRGSAHFGVSGHCSAPFPAPH